MKKKLMKKKNLMKKIENHDYSGYISELIDKDIDFHEYLNEINYRKYLTDIDIYYIVERK